VIGAPLRHGRRLSVGMVFAYIAYNTHVFCRRARR